MAWQAAHPFTPAKLVMSKVSALVTILVGHQSPAPASFLNAPLFDPSASWHLDYRLSSLYVLLSIPLRCCFEYAAVRESLTASLLP